MDSIPKSKILDLKTSCKSVALQRIIDEIRVDRVQGNSMYNRVYSRHNRS
jgi:hypothetical protein